MYNLIRTRVLVLCLLLCAAAAATHVSATPITAGTARLSLLTASPGEELYASFGHSAIRLRDSVANVDVVFNYGVFDFDAPNFYGNFARGRMRYCLAQSSYQRFVSPYMAEGRYIYEQTLRLDSIQTVFMINFLINNARPENRYYRYHFFLDNCATRIRDLIAKTCPGIVWPVATEHPTYRKLVYDCTKEHLWGRFVIDIALGLPTDAQTDTWKQMFLPEHLAKACAEATWNGKPIAGPSHEIVTPAIPLVVKHVPLTPMMVTCAVLLLAVMFCFVRRGARVFDFTLFFAAGLTGLLICFLWFFTDHTNTHGNLNIIWALPSHAVMAFFLLSRKRRMRARGYFAFTASVALLLLAAWAFLPQHLNIALVPVALALAVRAFANSSFTFARKQ